MLDALYFSRLTFLLEGLTPVESPSHEVTFVGARNGYLLAITPVGDPAASLAVQLSFLMRGYPGPPNAGENTSVKVHARFARTAWLSVKSAIRARTTEFALQARVRLRRVRLAENDASGSEDVWQLARRWLRSYSTEQRGNTDAELRWDYAEPHQVSALVEAVVGALKRSAPPLPQVCEICRSNMPPNVLLRDGIPRYVCAECGRRG